MRGASYAASLSLKWQRYEWVTCCHLHSLFICSNVTDFLLEHVQMYSHNKWLESSVAVNGIFNEGLRPRRPVVFCWPSRRIQAPLSNWQDFQSVANWIRNVLFIRLSLGTKADWGPLWGGNTITQESFVVWGDGSGQRSHLTRGTQFPPRLCMEELFHLKN